MTNYLLDDEHRLVPVHDLIAWAVAWRRLKECGGHRVALDELPGDIVISTVFLGSAIEFTPRPPRAFQTMVRAPGDQFDDAVEQSSTWAEAEVQHAKMVAWVKEQVAAKVRPIDPDSLPDLTEDDILAAYKDGRTFTVKPTPTERREP